MHPSTEGAGSCVNGSRNDNIFTLILGFASDSMPQGSAADFAARIDPRQINRMQIENLARGGAFDTLEPNRARVFTGAETILRRAQAEAEVRCF